MHKANTISKTTLAIIIISVTLITGLVMSWFMQKETVAPSPENNQQNVVSPTKTITYTCSDNKSLKAEYADRQVTLELNDGTQYTLEQSGTQYIGEDSNIIFSADGNNVVFTQDGKNIVTNCTENQSPTL